MTREVNFDKLIEVNKLHQGDIVKLTSGESAEFIRLKAKKFIGKINDKMYDIPVNMFDSVIEKTTKTIADTQEQTLETVKELKQGDWFYINKNGSAIAFKFEAYSGNKIIGINPITNTQCRIDNSFEIGKIN